jgi:biotin carboxyl carrier protein
VKQDRLFNIQIEIQKMKKQFRITLNGKSYDVVAEVIGEEEVSAAPAAPRATRAAAPAAAPAAAAPKAAPAAAGAGTVPSPLAGKVVSVDCALGDRVSAGQKIMTLEAMKMNTIVSAPAGGTVKAINVSAGDQVEEGQGLLVIQ